MKSKIIATMVLIFLLSGSMTASAIPSSYDGYPVVNLALNNQPIKSEVPALNFHGNTLVPIRIVAEQLGANVSWNQEAQTVFITKNETAINNDNKDSVSNTQDNKVILNFLKQLDISILRIKAMHERITLIEKAYLAETNNDLTRDLEKIYDKEIPSEVNDVFDKTTELLKIKEIYKDHNEIGKIQDYLSVDNDALSKYKIAVDEFLQYANTNDNRDLKNAYLYMYLGYSLLSDIEYKVKAEILRLEQTK